MKIQNATRALSMAVLVLAAAACSRGPELQTRTFQLRGLSSDQAKALLQPYVYENRERAPGELSVSSKAVTVRELPENLDRIQAVLEKYDAPTASLRLRFRVIEADGFSGTDPAIAGVESELKKLFQFRGYRLAASSVLQGLEGQQFQQRMSGASASYIVDGQVLRVDRTGSPGSVAMHVRLFRGANDVLFQTSVSVPVGQTVVLGSGQPRDKAPAAILVVTPELSDGASTGG